MQIVALGNCQINTSLKTSYQNVMIRKIVIVEDYFSKCVNSRLITKGVNGKRVFK